MHCHRFLRFPPSLLLLAGAFGAASPAPAVAQPSFYELAKLVAEETGGYDQMGEAIGFSGDTAVVGAPGTSDDSGVVYVFERDAVGGPTARLVASDAAPFARFGKAVDIDGDTVVVGAHGQDDDWTATPGKFYVFERDAGDPEAWQEVARVAGSDDLGFAVAIDGDRLVVGGEQSADDLGVVWVHERDAGGLGAAYVFEAIAVDPALAVVGTCPGVVDLTASGLTPKGLLRVLGSPSEGDSEPGGGPCVGTPVGLDSPRTLRQTRADPDGVLGASPDLPEAVCGGFVQVIDETTCAVTEVVQLP